MILRQKLVPDVGRTMNPFMTATTQCHDVGKVETAIRVTGPWPDVVRMESAPTPLSHTAPLAPVVVALVNGPDCSLPLARRIKTLTLWRTSVFVVRVALPGSTRHPVPLATKMRLWYRCLLTQYLARLFRVLVAEERIWVLGMFLVVIRAFEILTSRASRYTKISKLFINTFWVATYNLRDVIGRELLVNVFLTQPISVKMQRFSVHDYILHQSMAVMTC